MPEADRASEVFYVNIDDLEHAISQAAGEDRNITDNVTPLQALGLSTWAEAGVLHGSFKISTN